MDHKKRAGMNRTLELGNGDRQRIRPRLIDTLPVHVLPVPPEGTIYGDCKSWARFLPKSFVDLLILDPPYNLNKSFNDLKFAKRDVDEYTAWLTELLATMKPILRPRASIYICGEWFSSLSIFAAASSHFIVRNRVTWEREKGRGARANWKNSSEDIWFCTASEEYTFNVDSVKLRRKVLAPYTNGDGSPKDWTRTAEGDFRDTHPSNVWTDITVPFWSMPENTDHPTQKSEKLIAKLVLASTNPGDFVLDPLLGSGTTSVVAKKLGRRYLGIEIDEEYCLLAERRLEIAERDKSIQGFADGVFWERNTLALRSNGRPFLRRRPQQSSELGSTVLDAPTVCLGGEFSQISGSNNQHCTIRRSPQSHAATECEYPSLG
jgi:site-specific DNA-methyltransferase (adenine-specific)